MLPDLSKIDWSSFIHAYGPADDVPELLRAMLDPATAAGAFASFDASVNHQGWVTPAAVPCVPWLVAALDEPGAPLAELIRRLADLAVNGNHESWIGDRMIVETEPTLFDPVLAGHGTFVDLLGHADPDVRANAALALAVLRERADEAAAPLKSALAAEGKSEVKASLILALGVLGSAEDLPAIAAASGGKRVAIAIRVAAACARIWLAPDDISDDDLLELLTVAGTPKRVKGLPWADGALNEIAKSVLMAALSQHVDVARVTMLLELVEGKIAKDIVTTLVKNAFPKGATYARREELSGGQLSALKLMADYDLTSRVADLVGEAGLPSRQRGIRIFLGVEPGGLLDREVELHGMTTPLWAALRRAIREELHLADLAPAVAAQFGLDDTLSAVRELLHDRHHYADIVHVFAFTGFAHDDAPASRNTEERMAELIAGLLRPFGEALRPIAERELGEQLDKEHPPHVETVAWLTILARLGPLDPMWDALVRTCVEGPPASRCPKLLGEALMSVDLARRDAIVLARPLIRFNGSTTSSGGEVIFEWRAAWAAEGWFYLWACPTPAALQAVVGAIRSWSDLPPMPDPKTIPRGCFATPHAPFPYRRAEETFAHWDTTEIRTALDGLAADPSVDATIVQRLLAALPAS